MTLQMITANCLADGLVVYQAADDSWCSLIQDAEVIEDEDALQARLSQAKAAEGNQAVVGVYEVEVTEDEGCIRPVRLRERIRAFGPTSHPEFGRGQAPEDLSPTTISG